MKRPPLVFFAAALLVVVAAVLVPASPARAGGGLFLPAGEATVATRHRMVVALSPKETTLWDEMRHDGRPADFVWVLPTPAPAEIALASPDLFTWLDDATRPRVFPPAGLPTDGSRLGLASSGGVGCAGSAATRAQGAPAPGRHDAEDPTVAVDERPRVGPYEQLVVEASSETALVGWLVDRGYVVPESVRPALRSYVERGWVFHVLRVRPDIDADAAQALPVRVTLPAPPDEPRPGPVAGGPAAALPLRLAVAGAAARIEVVLWVIGERRYSVSTYDTVELDEGRLRWDAALGRSNYEELLDDTIARRGGRAFVVEYAQPFPVATDTAPPNVLSDASFARAAGAGPLHLTRLRTRTAPARLDADLALAPSASDGPISALHFLSDAQVVGQTVGAATTSVPPLALVLLAAAGARRWRVRRARRR